MAFKKVGFIKGGNIYWGIQGQGYNLKFMKYNLMGIPGEIYFIAIQM